MLVLNNNKNNCISVGNFPDYTDTTVVLLFCFSLPNSNLYVRLYSSVNK